MIVILVVLCLFAALFVAERVRPARAMPEVRGWSTRAWAFNALALVCFVLAGHTWEPWLREHALWRLDLPAPIAGMIGFLFFQVFYYGWHRARHDCPFLWRAIHQVHHSPRRIEMLTTYYLHPLEFILTLLMAGTLVYGVLGLSGAAVAWFALLEGGLEALAHTNIRTPYWLGFVLQRPEMHRYHHETGKHRANYALPLMDMLFGTWINPKSDPRFECGFTEDRETQLGRMLRGGDVHR